MSHCISSSGPRPAALRIGHTLGGLAPGRASAVKPVRTPVAIFGSLGVCIYVLTSRHWLISYSPIHLT